MQKNNARSNQRNSQNRWIQKTILGLFLVLGMLFGSEASAYTTNGVKWPGNWPVVYYHVNAASFPASVGTQQQIIDAIKKGANHWNFESQGKITLVYAGTTTVGCPSQDGNNVLCYNPGQCPSGCIANTAWWATSGNLTEFDITFYGKDQFDMTVNWKAFDPIIFAEDLWGWAAHELGHGVGLGHSTITTATMYSTPWPGATYLRFLIQDDINGHQSIYGANTDMAISNTNPTAGQDVTLTVDYLDSAGKTYQFLATLNGQNPGLDLSTIDPNDYRILNLNLPWLDMLPLPQYFSNTVGAMDSQGKGTMTFHTTGLSGLCIDFAAVVIDAGWPTSLRHVTPAGQVCVQ